MRQIEALQNALNALRAHAMSGNDDAEEAYFVVENMLAKLIRRRAKERQKQRWRAYKRSVTRR